MTRRTGRDSFFDAVTVVQRFVCAFQEGRLLRPSLSKSLPDLTAENERLALDGLLFALGRRLDRRGQLSRLVEQEGLAPAIETLARRRLGEQRTSLDRAAAVGDVCLSDLAHDRGLSAATLRRRIGKAAGMPPRELRRRQRVWRGVELIRTGMKIESAAHECGYRSERSFYSAFRGLTGMSPASVRTLTKAETSELEKRVLPYQSVGR